MALVFLVKGIMFRELFFKLLLMPNVREGINCVLRYVLAQPVEMDVLVTINLVSEYTGFSLLLSRNSANEDRLEENLPEGSLQAEYAA